MINAFDNLLTIELNEYGFQIDTEWFYIALSWQLIILSVLGVTLYKVIKRKKNK